MLLVLFAQFLCKLKIAQKYKAYSYKKTDGAEWKNKQIHNYSTDFKMCLLATDRTTGQKVSKDTGDLKT